MTPCRSADFHQFLFGLCAFHAIVQERSRLHAWHAPCQVGHADFSVAARQLLAICSESEGATPLLPAMLYLIGECIYAGRMADARDRRALLSLLQKCFAGAGRSATTVWQPITYHCLCAFAGRPSEPVCLLVIPEQQQNPLQVA